MTDSSRSIRGQWERRSGIAPLTLRGFLLWLGILALAAPTAWAQSVDSTPGEFRRIVQREHASQSPRHRLKPRLRFPTWSQGFSRSGREAGERCGAK